MRMSHPETYVELFGAGSVGSLKARKRHADQPNTFGWGKHRAYKVDADAA